VTKQSTEAARVRVARLPQSADSWECYQMHPGEDQWSWFDRWLDREKAILAVRDNVEYDDDFRGLVTRYPGDPEAMYFDRDHPEGVPVEWEDAR